MNGVNVALILQILGDLRKSIALAQHYDIDIFAEALNCIYYLLRTHYGRIYKRHFVLYCVGRDD